SGARGTKGQKADGRGVPSNHRRQEMADEKKGGMTVAEAGRKGGVKVAQERGRAFYEQIGKKGGETVKAERGHEFYEKIGKKGGESVRASRGPEFYSQIGHKGGQKVRELIEQGKRLGRAAAKKTEESESEGEGKAPTGGAGMNTGKSEELKASCLDGARRQCLDWPP